MQVIGRYALFDELARGGMATVHLGRLIGPAGFSRTVAIKRLHPHLAKDPEFVTMLLDEARLAGRIQHPNVVSTLDIVSSDGELFIVMDYLHGETLSRLLRATLSASKSKSNEAVEADVAPSGLGIPPTIAAAIIIDTLHGLHAAHEVKGERGELLGLVHRDFTPQNIMIRRDGTALVVDFGVAKAAGRFHTTEEGKIKGKLPYMAPEQVRAIAISRRTDIYAAGAVFWEALVGERLRRGASEAEVLEQLLFGTVDAPSSRAPGIPKALDEVIMRALSRDPEKRFATADEMAKAIESAIEPARASKVAAWMEMLVGDSLSAQAAKLAIVETFDSSDLSAAANDAFSGTSPTKVEIARPGPLLTPSEIRRSMTDSSEAPIAAPLPIEPPTHAAPPPNDLITSASQGAVMSKRSPTTSSFRSGALWIGGVALVTVLVFFVFERRESAPRRNEGQPPDSPSAPTSPSSQPLNAPSSSPPSFEPIVFEPTERFAERCDRSGTLHSRAHRDESAAEHSQASSDAEERRLLGTDVHRFHR